ASTELHTLSLHDALPIFPSVRIVSKRTSLHHSMLIVLDTLQPTILRLYTSIMANMYMNPRNMGMYVISACQTWFGRSIFKPFSRYGYLWSLALTLLRFGFG